MSTSWSRSLDGQRRRRPRRSSVPIEIQAIKSPPLASSAHDANKKQARPSIWEPCAPRIALLPGSLLMPEGEPWLHPPEPVEPPPLPTEIVQFLVVGEPYSGKTTLTRRFQRMHCTHSITTSTKKSIKQQQGSGQWSVEYHKKDVTFWQQHDTVGCARVTLWDVTGGGPCDKPLERRQEWIRLVQKMSGILLVVSLEHGPKALLNNILQWKRWLDECCPTHPQVHLFLQKSDLLPTQSDIHPMVWMGLGSSISKLCDETGICDWRMTTCDTQTAEHSPEEAIIELVQSIVTTSVPRRKVSFQKSPTRNVSRASRMNSSHGRKLLS